MNTPLIKTENLTKIYGRGVAEIRALDGVDLTIVRGEFVAIVGASGSGKSTLMNMLGGLDRPDMGSMSIAGQDLGQMSNKALAKFRKQFQLLPKKSALANVMLPLQYRRPRLVGEKALAEQSLERVGMSDRTSHKPTELSGGQQQRVAIARALVDAPELLLADEPTGALDSKTSTDVMALLKKLNAQDITIVLITHDPEIAAYASRVITMCDGKITEDKRAGQPS